MAQTIAIFNQAGGVGKTTEALNLGYQLTQKGQRVLLIDLDPQASLTTFLGVDPTELTSTLADALVADATPELKTDLHGIDLIPANILLSSAEIQLVNLDFRELRLKEAIDRIANAYDTILIDCPPSLGILSLNGLIGADYVLIPIETHFKAFMGTSLILETIAKVQKRGNPNLRILGIIPSRYARQNSQDQRCLAAIEEQYGNLAPVFSPVPRLTAIADASEAHMPLACYDPSSKAVAVYTSHAAQLLDLVAS